MFPYEMRFSPTTYECGPGGSMNLHSLMHHIQEAAARHAEVLGVGMEWMREHGNMWVLINFRIDIKALPEWEDEVTIWTWPSGYDSLRAFREFTGRDQDGNELFIASSDWLVLDAERKMPVPFTDLKLDVPRKGDRHFSDMARLKEKNGYIPAYRIVVGRSSIDMNGHVNNTEYIRWGTDAISSIGIDASRIGSLKITYAAEVFQGDEIEISHVETGGSRSLKGERGGRTVFLMEIR